MSEVTFAKSFLATLDKRAIKLPADHVSDPRKYPSESPYILPKGPHPFPRRISATTQQVDSKTVNISLKPMRAGETISLSSISLDSTVHDVKTQYAAKSGIAQDKIKILLNKKPAADLKTLKDLGVEQDVELSVMIMGGGGVQTPTPSASPVVEKGEPATAAPAPAPAAGEEDKMDVDPSPESEKAQAEAAQRQQQDSTSSTEQLLSTEDFWSDLEGFLVQRLRDENEGKRLVRLFRETASKR